MVWHFLRPMVCAFLRGYLYCYRCFYRCSGGNQGICVVKQSKGNTTNGFFTHPPSHIVKSWACKRSSVLIDARQSVLTSRHCAALVPMLLSTSSDFKGTLSTTPLPTINTTDVTVVSRVPSDQTRTLRLAVAATGMGTSTSMAVK